MSTSRSSGRIRMALTALATLSIAGCALGSVVDERAISTARAEAVQQFVRRLEKLGLDMSIPESRFTKDPIASRAYATQYGSAFVLGLLGQMHTSFPPNWTDAQRHGWSDGQRAGFVALLELCDEFGAGPLVEDSSPK
jgi:hypothetical protein